MARRRVQDSIGDHDRRGAEPLEPARGLDGNRVSRRLSRWTPADDGPQREPWLEPAVDRPAPAPRPVPPTFKGAPGGFVLLLVGGVFVLISTVFIVTGLGLLIGGGSMLGLFFTLFPLIHFVVGSALLVYALRERTRRRALVTDGTSALAEVVEVGIDRRVRINGVSPHKVTFVFDVNGAAHEASTSSMEAAMRDHLPGDRVWIVHDPDDPANAMLWPPM